MDQILQIIKDSYIFLIITVVIGILAHLVLYRILVKITEKTKTIFDNSLIRHCYKPLLWIIILLVIRTGLKIAAPAQTIMKLDSLLHIIGLLIIIIAYWLIFKLTFVLEDYLLERYKIDEKDNLRARKIHTQLQVLKKIVIVTVGVLAVGTILMTFENIRQLGTTILASAGIIGIVVGMAAQKTIGNFIAGIQIAFTQPIRLDDVVIVENEWGRIEEISLTYVIVKIWDLRRLVVPINYFIEKPFQNWTRTSADILGTVFIYVDYTVPVEAIREQLEKILKDSPLWDGKVCVVQVTNATERTVEVRALMSAADASSCWTLRCEVREKLIDFIGKNYPDALPKTRAELDNKSKKP